MYHDNIIKRENKEQLESCIESYFAGKKGNVNGKVRRLKEK
jgi:hypothetical protein